MVALVKSAICGILIFAGLGRSAHAQIGGIKWATAALNFKVQSPTNAPESARYFVTNSPLPTYHCLVYSNDGAFEAGNTTSPRTEQRFNPDYTNGEIQYQATLMAAANENSYCVFQIHTGDAESDAYGSTTFMLFWFSSDGGSVHDYSGTELAANLGNQWFQLNVDHNMVTGTIRVWINQKLVWTQQDNGAGDFYFKDGVYEQSHGPSDRMDTFVTNILMWVSSGTNPPAAPTGLAAAPSLTQIGLAWNASVGATNYNLKRATASTGPYTNLASLTGTNDTDARVIPGPAYYYVVSALDQFGESSNSAPAVASLLTLKFSPEGIKLTGGKLTASGTGGVPNGSFQVLSATNLATMPILWTVATTNAFDASGNFNVTLPVATNRTPEFFRLLFP